MKTRHKRGTNNITLVFHERTEQKKIDKICSLNDSTLKYLISKKPRSAMIQITRGYHPRTVDRKRREGIPLMDYFSSTRVTHPDFKITYNNFLDWICNEVEIDTDEMEEKYPPDDPETDLNIRAIRIFFYD